MFDLIVIIYFSPYCCYYHLLFALFLSFAFVSIFIINFWLYYYYCYYLLFTLFLLCTFLFVCISYFWIYHHRLLIYDIHLLLVLIISAGFFLTQLNWTLNGRWVSLRELLLIFSGFSLFHVSNRRYRRHRRHRRRCKRYTSYDGAGGASTETSTEVADAFLHLLKCLHPDGLPVLPWLRPMFTHHLTIVRWTFSINAVARFLASSTVRRPRTER